jgi:hypothetical protein
MKTFYMCIITESLQVIFRFQNFLVKLGYIKQMFKFDYTILFRS